MRQRPACTTRPQLSSGGCESNGHADRARKAGPSSNINNPPKLHGLLPPTLLGAIIILVGMNASGLMLVDQAYEQPVRGFAAAFLGGMQAAL